MGKRLSDVEIVRYHRDGFLSPLDAFSPEEARGFRDRLEDFERRDGRQFGKGHNFKPHLLFPWVDALVRHPAVLDPVEDIIGPDIRLFHFTIWPKSSGDPAYVSWHQDATYFGLEPAVHITAWVALTDVPVESGAVQVVPGSHARGQLHHGQFNAPDNLLSRGQTLTEDFARDGSVFMTLKPGQMSLHHTHLIHRSGPNLSSDRRIGFGISYIPTSAWCRAGTRQSAMLVRGVDRFGNFDDEPRPRVDYGAAEQAAHAEAVLRFRAQNAEEVLRYEAAQ
ncbi:MAG TPA: phytanoyl-CoA dioxygenase family protein [Stellaceae bacterium]|jgi:non-heme Fe2+,alpha-ketoglutarate-dependent halogenase|nr:phytanoyl-CoA dioxygenase family protein [Stellaceae bacterium]